MVMAYNGVSSSVLPLPPAFDVAESSLLGEFKLLSNFLDTCNDDERDDVLSRKLRAICKRPLLRAPSSNLEMKYTRGQDRDYSEVARYEIIGGCLSLRPCNAALKSREDLNFIGILNERERRLPLLTEALLMEEKLEKIGVEEAR